MEMMWWVVLVCIYLIGVHLNAKVVVNTMLPDICNGITGQPFVTKAIIGLLLTLVIVGSWLTLIIAIIMGGFNGKNK